MKTYPDASSPPGNGLYKHVYKPLDTVTSYLEHVLLVVCSLAILISMIITAIDVVLRYGFSSPLGWSFDFIMLYTLPAAYYLAFSYSLKSGSHLSVDFFSSKLPATINQWIYPLVMALASAFFFYVGFLTAEETYISFTENDTLFGAISWITWPTDAIICVSMLVFATRMALKACESAFFKDATQWK